MEHNAMARYSTRRFLTVIGTIVLATTFVYCRPWRNKSPEERAEWITKKITKELDLTESQKNELTRIKEEILAKHRAEKAQRDAQFQELAALVKSDTIDKAKLAELKKKHLALRNSTEDLFLEKGIEFHKILTPEQRVKASETMQKHAKRFSEDK